MNLTYYRNVANDGRGSEMTKVIHELCAAVEEIEGIAQELRKLHEKPACGIGEVGAVIARLDEFRGREIG